MAHEKMFTDDDEILERIRTLALAFPGAAEKVSHGRPAFHTAKVFAWYGMSRKTEEGWVQHPQSVCVLLPEAERRAVRELPHCWVPSYLGPYGWLGLDLDEGTDWDEVAELLDDSFRMTASRRLIVQLDGR